MLVLSDWIQRFKPLTVNKQKQVIEFIKQGEKYTPNICDYLKDGDWYYHSGDLVIPENVDMNIGLVVEGNLIVHGFYDDYVSNIGIVVVLGDFVAENIVSWGSIFTKGDIYAQGMIYGYYNDFTFEVSGHVFARALVLYDKSSSYNVGFLEVEIDPYDPEVEQLRRAHSLFVPEIFEEVEDDDFEDEDEIYPPHPDYEKVRSNLVQGLTLFKSYKPLEPYSSPTSKGIAEKLLEEKKLKQEVFTLSTSVQRLKELAAKNSSLEKFVAQRINLSPELIDILASSKNIETLKVSAKHPQITAEKLEVLAKHSDIGIKCAVALNRNTKEVVLKKLHSENEDVRQALAAREMLSDSLIKELVKDSSAKVRLTLVHRKDIKDEYLEQFSRDEDAEIRRIAALKGFNTNLLADPDPKVRAMAVRKADYNTLKPYIEQLARDSNAAVREVVAWYRNYHSPEILIQLAQDSDVKVRKAVARNPLTPDSALYKLAQDNDIKVLESLSQHLFVSKDVLDKLVQKVPKNFRYDPISDYKKEFESKMFATINNLLKHPSIDPETLRNLYKKNPPHFHEGDALSQNNWPADLVIKFAVGDTPDTYDTPEEQADYQHVYETYETKPLAEVLRFMLQSRVYYFRRAAAASRFTPVDALENYWHTANKEEERYNLDDFAHNPSIPLNILEEILIEGNYVYDMLKNPYLPTSILQKIITHPNEEVQSYKEQAQQMLRVRQLRQELSIK